MFSGENKIIQEIRDLLRNYKLDIAKEKLEKLEKRENLSEEDKIRLKFLHSLYYDIKSYKENNQEYSQKALEISTQGLDESRKIGNKLLIIDALHNNADILIRQHLYKEAIERSSEAENLISTFNLQTPDLIERKAKNCFLKGASYTWLGKHDTAEEILLEGLEYCKKIGEKYIQNRIWIHLAGIGISQGNFKKIIKYLEKGLNLALEIDNKPNIAHFYDTLGASYQWYGKYDTALDYIQKAMALQKEIGITNYLTKSRLGFHFFYTGDLEKAVEILDETTPKLLESSEKRWRLYGNWQSGLINWLKGNLDEAIKTGINAVKIAEEMNDRYHTDLFNVFLAAFYFDKGNYNQTLNLCLQSIESSQKQQEKYTIAFANFLLGKVYHIKGEYEIAWDYAHKGLQQRKEMDALHHIIDSLFSLIQILIDKNDITQAESYLKELIVFVDKKPTKRFVQIKKISDAIIKKASTRPRLWIKAIDVLEEVVNDEVIDYSLTIIALINLCELLINEFSFSGESEVLLELEKYTEMLEKKAKEQQTYNLRLEASNIRLLIMWLKAQYSIADIDFHKAKELLIEAQNMADEEGLTRLAEKITKHQVKFIERIDQWDDFIKKYYEFIKE